MRHNLHVFPYMFQIYQVLTATVINAREMFSYAIIWKLEAGEIMW